MKTKKKRNIIITIVLAIVAVFAVIAIIELKPLQDDQGFVFEYLNTTEYLTITQYKGTATEITVPNEFKNAPVKVISADAFRDCDQISSITIPDSIINIGAYKESQAFDGCTNLASITVSKGNEYYSSIDGILYDKAKTMIYFVPDVITGTISIPDSYNNHSDLASTFVGRDGITNINVSEDNKYFKSIDGNVYSKDGKILIRYAPGKSTTSFTIPNSVTSIGEYAFDSCSNLTSLVIPDGVISIGRYAFKDCVNLESLMLPLSLEHIDNHAFDTCNNLNIYYEGRLDQYHISITVTIGDNTPPPVTFYYYSETEPTEEENFWHYDENGNVVVWN